MRTKFSRATLNGEPRFGKRYANPAQLPTASGIGVAFDLGGQSLITTQSAAPYINAYQWSPAGFGSKFPAPSTPINTEARNIAVTGTISEQAIAFTLSSLTGVNAYQWSPVSGFGAKYADPATPLNSQCTGITFSPDGSVVLIGLEQAPYIAAYQWSYASGFGTRYADPAIGSEITAIARSVVFHPNGNVVFVAFEASPYIAAYEWSNATGFGSRFPDPAVLPGLPLTARNMRISPRGDLLVVAHDSPGYAKIYNWNANGFGASLASATNFITVAPSGIAFHPSGTRLAVSLSSGSTGISVNELNWLGIGKPYGTPADLPRSQSGACAFSPDGSTFVAMHPSSPFISVYPFSL
jgi:hypothetical protein